MSKKRKTGKRKTENVFRLMVTGSCLNKKQLIKQLKLIAHEPECVLVAMNTVKLELEAMNILKKMNLQVIYMPASIGKFGVSAIYYRNYFLLKHFKPSLTLAFYKKEIDKYTEYTLKHVKKFKLDFREVVS